YTPEEVAGQWLPNLIVPEELRAEALNYRDRLISGNRVELEAIRQRKDGVRFDVSVVARGISLSFDHGAFYLIYRDIAERKKARMEASGKEWLDSQIDFRIILPDGTIKHLHSVAHPVRDDSGEITEVVGTVMDVTEQWQARTELEKAIEGIKQRTEAARRSER